MITARSNPQLKALATLLRKRSAREEERVFVCEGKKMFFEILSQHPKSLEKVYLSERGLASLTEEEKERLAGCTFEIVSDEAFDAVAETVTPQGVLATVHMPEYSLSELLKGERARLLVLERLQDPGNLGTILRTAEAAGMNGVILSADSVDAFNPKVVRSTMGAILRVPFLYAEDWSAMLDSLKSAGVTLYAAHLQGSVPYTEPCYGERCAILIGNEANGLTDETTAKADVRVRIPMEGQAESLNAAVAAAILMYRAVL